VLHRSLINTLKKAPGQSLAALRKMLIKAGREYPKHEPERIIIIITVIKKIII
jgi:hypothetical protein